MANHLSESEKWFKARLAAIGGLTAVVGARLYNSLAPPMKTLNPYLVYTFTPLENNKGQKGLTLQSRFLIDAIIYTGFSTQEAVDTAVGAMNDYFENPALVRTTGTIMVSIVADRPINRMNTGVIADQQTIARGTTFKLYVADL